MKKKLTLLTISIIVSLCAVAQTQQGIVKTPGRLGGNGQVIPGNRLSGATIKVKGRNTVMSNSRGEFSFPIPANKFFLDSVKLKNYVLVDPEATARQYTYSTNPLILLMEKPDQQTDILLANEQTIRNTLQEKLQAKEAEIEALKKQNKITQEEYRKAMQQLFAEQESNEKLIKEMAERYSQIDFDQMDELNQRISDCIMNGRLTEADSLLSTKGDIKTRIEKLNKQHEANVEVRDNLEKSETMEQKDREDIAQDCNLRFEILFINHQNDSAAQYLELRAALDTTNLDWQLEAGNFIDEFLANYDLALEYYQRGLRQSLIQEGEVSEWAATFINKIGMVYCKKSDDEQALEYFRKSLIIHERAYDSDHDIATSYNNIGSVYNDKGDYAQAMEYLRKSLAIYLQVYGPDHPEVANCYNNIGTVYYMKGDSAQAIEYLRKALVIFLLAYGPNDTDVANSYNNIGYIYYMNGDYSQAMECYKKALVNYERYYGPDHPKVATLLNNIGMVYCDQDDYHLTQALEYCQKSLTIHERVYGHVHPSVAMSYNNIGGIYDKKGDYAHALELYQKSLTILDQIYGSGHPNAAICYDNIGGIYSSQGDYDQALEYCQKSLAIRLQTYGQDHPDIAKCYNNIASVYNNNGDYDQALEYYLKELSICKRIYDPEDPNVVLCYDKIGFVLLSQGDTNQALEQHQKSLDIRLQVDGPEHTSVANSYDIIGFDYLSQGDIDQALKYYQKSLAIHLHVDGPNCPDVAQYYDNIGFGYLLLGDTAQAFEYYQKSLAIRLKAYGPDHLDVAKCHKNIGMVYFKLEEYDKALDYYKKSIAIMKKTWADSHPDVISVEKEIMLLQYKLATINGNIQNFLTNHCLTFLTFIIDNGEARQQGMSGEYFILEFADWNYNIPASLIDKSDQLRGKPVDIVVMKNGVISKHHFVSDIGAHLSFKHITKEEKEHINQLYEKWKSENKE